MRIALGIEYQGRKFSGWQIQLGVRTVQECVERAISKVANHPLRVICAGRTDTGVHAIGQVVHFDTHAERSIHSWQSGANANLPSDVSVRWAHQVDDNFHARFSAVRRQYRYLIYNHRVRPAIAAHQVNWDYRPLNEQAMSDASASLLGEHDFSSYRAYACQAKSAIRTIYRLDVTRMGDYVMIDVEANAFLHHMVRNIAGVLMAIGAGEHSPVWAAEVLEKKDRQLGGVTAPPQGLYFVRVVYPDTHGLPCSTPDLRYTNPVMAVSK